MATQLKHTDFQPYPSTRPNLRVAFDTTTATNAIAAAMADMPAATRGATLDELAQPSLTRWNQARATLTRAEQAAEACPQEPEAEFNTAVSALADAQIALLTTPAPTQAELAVKVRLYFEIDAAEFHEPSIAVSIQADADRLLATTHADTSEWAAALDEWSEARAAVNVRGLTDEQVDDLAGREMAAARRLLALPGSSVADIAAKLRVWMSIVPVGEEFEPAGILADLERLATPPAPDAAFDSQTRIGADAEALIATARHVLSSHMFDTFLRWGETAATADADCDDDDLLDVRADKRRNVIDQIHASVPITFEDYAFKTWVAAIEAGDCPCMGPLVPRDSFGKGIRDGVASIAGDLSRMSTIVRELDRFGAKAWDLAGSGVIWPVPLCDAVLAAFETAQQAFGDLPAAETFTRREVERTPTPFYRGLLMEWDKAYASYREAVAASAEATGETDPDNHAGAAEAYALHRLMLLPSPSPAALAIKARIYEETESWHLNAADDIARVFASDTRRFAKLGAFPQTDKPLLAAFEAYRLANVEYHALPDTATQAEEEPYFARMDEPMEALLTTRAATVEGVLAKMLYGFRAVNQSGWADDVLLEPNSPRFREGLAMCSMYERTLWNAIEDLARIAGVSLTEKLA